MSRRLPPAALVLLAAASLADAAPEPREAPKAPLTAEIDGDQLLTRAAFLAGDEFQGRESGTEGGARAEEYVAAEFARFGLTPAGPSGSRFQEVALPARPILAEDCRFEVRVGASTWTAAPADGAVPFSNSPEGALAAPVAFAGYGISSPAKGYDDLAGIDLRGKIALVLRHGPREDDANSPWYLRRRDPALFEEISFEGKVKRAAAAGAVAVVIVNDRHHKDEALPTDGGRGTLPVPAFAVSRRAANEILRPLGKEIADLERAIDRDLAPRSCDVPGATVTLRAALGAPTARNVLFERPGVDPALADEVVVVSAHTDHVGLGWFGSLATGRGEVHNGADDNASGVAALLEIAESLAAGPPMRRTVLFAAWCAEEKGLVGSESWCTMPTRPLAKVVANVNLDMVGRYRDGGDDGKGLVASGLPTGSGFAEKLEAAAKPEGLRITPSWEAWEQSDHFSLYQRKVPVVFLHTGLHGDYHRPADDWWKLESGATARIARCAAGFVRRLADDDGRPAFTERPKRAALGVALADGEGGGAAFGQVFPGFAAAAAGMQPGDVVVSFGGQRVKDAEALSTLLAARKPGDEVELVYRRKGAETTVRVKLSGR